MRKIEYAPIAMPLYNFISLLERNAYETNDNYQKNIPWDRELQEDLIYSIFLGLPIGTITIFVNDNKEIVNGLQRTSTILSFYNNRLKLSSEKGKQIAQVFIEELSSSQDKKDQKFFKLLSRPIFPELKYSDLPEIMKEHFQNYLVSLVEIRYADCETIFNYFKIIQNSEMLKGQQIAKALPDNKINKILNPTQYNELSSLLKLNKKDDLSKLLVQFHGLYEEAIPLGISDKRIFEYAKRNPDVQSSFKFRMIKFYEKLVEEKDSIQNINLNKSMIKIIFLFVLYTDEWKEKPIKQLLETIENLYNQNKVVFSSKASSVEIDKNINDLINLTRSTHNVNEVKEVILNTNLEY